MDEDPALLGDTQANMFQFSLNTGKTNSYKYVQNHNVII